MSPRTNGFKGRYIVVADQDKAVAGMVIDTLLNEGHAVFHAYDGLSALHLALNLKVCDLVISNTRVGGKIGIDLIRELREQLPSLAILYLSNNGSTLQTEAGLPHDVPVLREPFTSEELRAAVHYLLT
jgi:DNA-binding response OmpR family regulator